MAQTDGEMVSATKVPVTPAELELICTELMGDGLSEAAPLGDGWYNAAYGVSLAGGGRGVVKIAPPAAIQVMKYERDILASEVTVMRSLQGLVPLPKILAEDREGRLIGRPLYIMEWLKGRPLNHCYDDLGSEGLARVRTEVGGWVKAMNQVLGESFGMVAGPGFPNWPEAFSHLFSDLLEDGRAKEVDLPYELLERVLAEGRGSLRSVQIPQLVHWDLWDGNVFVNQEGEITGLIDFERSLYGDPLMEHCFMERHPEFLQGYGPNELDSELGQIRRQLYDLYLFLVMAIEAHYRHYADPWVEQWGRAKTKETLLGWGIKEADLGGLASAVLP